MKAYDLVKNMTVAKFFYKGHHTHPVLKVGLVIKDRTNERMITMYVLRDGKQTYSLANAPVRSFTREKIAKYNSVRRPVRERLGINSQQMQQSTLERREITELMSVIG